MKNKDQFKDYPVKKQTDIDLDKICGLNFIVKTNDGNYYTKQL